MLLGVRLQAGCFAFAIGVALVPSPARAFDSVDWIWESEAEEIYAVSLALAVDFDPWILSMTELHQLQIGDVTAISTVEDGGPGYGVAQVDSIATAVSNNAAIATNESMALHLIQGAVGGTGGRSTVTDSRGAFVRSWVTAAGNALAMASGRPSVRLHATQGMLGTVAAVSEVQSILNGPVDSAAMAVGNSASVESAGGHAAVTMLARVIQGSVGSVSARSSVTQVSLTNDGAWATAPLVGSAATAVGNNLAIAAGL